MKNEGIMKISNPEDKDHFAHIRKTNKHIIVRFQDTILADTKNPLVLTEHGKFLYDSVFYINKDDVHVRMVSNKDKTSHCPIKGKASYWHWDELQNIAWSYEKPMEQSKVLKRYLSFDLRKVDLCLLAH